MVSRREDDEVRRYNFVLLRHDTTSLRVMRNGRGRTFKLSQIDNLVTTAYSAEFGLPYSVFKKEFIDPVPEGQKEQ